MMGMAGSAPCLASVGDGVQLVEGADKAAADGEHLQRHQGGRDDELPTEQADLHQLPTLAQGVECGAGGDVVVDEVDDGLDRTPAGLDDLLGRLVSGLHHVGSAQFRRDVEVPR